MVVAQDPRGGGLSAGDFVRLSVTKARYGLVPNFVGSSLEAAGREVQRLKLTSRITSGPGPIGHDSPAEPATRASPPRPASKSSSWSGTAHKERTADRVAPWQLDRARDADAGPDDDVDRLRGWLEAERRTVEGQPVVRSGDSERLREASGPRAEQPHVVETSTDAHLVDAVGGLERAQEHRCAVPASQQTTFAHQWTPYER